MHKTNKVGKIGTQYEGKKMNAHLVSRLHKNDRFMVTWFTNVRKL